MCEKIDIIKGKLKNLIDNFEPFTLILNDPSGNSYIENPYAPKIDKDMTIRKYIRNREQDILCKINLDCDNKTENFIESNDIKKEINNEKINDEIDENDELVKNMFQFQTNCEMCGHKMNLNVQKTAIPYFKEVLLYCSVCDACGFKTTEVKSIGEFGEYGTKLTLHIEGAHDMRRETLKSEYCSLIIPEFEIELPPGSIGSSFMTIEGLLEAILKELKATNPFAFGDTAPDTIKTRISDLIDKLIKVIDGEMKITLIMDDPTSNSYIQNLYAPDPDPQLTEEKYERTFEQNEDLGLNDMKTENY